MILLIRFIGCWRYIFPNQLPVKAEALVSPIVGRNIAYVRRVVNNPLECAMSAIRAMQIANPEAGKLVKQFLYCQSQKYADCRSQLN